MSIPPPTATTKATIYRVVGISLKNIISSTIIQTDSVSESAYAGPPLPYDTASTTDTNPIADVTDVRSTRLVSYTLFTFSMHIYIIRIITPVKAIASAII